MTADAPTVAQHPPPSPTLPGLVKNLLSRLPDSWDELSEKELIEIDYAATRIASSARSRLNTRSLINCLPPEILALIFERVVTWPHCGLNSRGYGPHPSEFRLAVKTRIRLTHVCQLWRYIATGLASLWTAMEISRTDRRVEYMARSQGLPLQVLIKPTSSFSSADALIPHGNRISELFFCYDDAETERLNDPDLPIQFPLLLSHLPNLTTLMVKSYDLDSTRDLDDVVPEDLVNMFPNGTPHLKRLLLDDQTWFPNVSYETLTHLHITRGGTLHLEIFLPLLQRCSALEELLLSRASFAPWNDFPAAENAITLPRLRKLTLVSGGIPTFEEQLLKFLIFPSTQFHLRILGGSNVFWTLSNSPIHLPFTRKFTKLLVEQYNNRHLSIPPLDTYRVEAAGGGSSVALKVSLSDFPLDEPFPVFHSLIPFDKIEQLTYRVCPSPFILFKFPLPPEVSLPSLKLLRFIDPPRGDSEEEEVAEWLAGTFSYLPDVEELEVWSGFARILSLLDRQRMPSLRKVTFHHIPLYPEQVHWRDHDIARITEDALLLKKYIPEVSTHPFCTHQPPLVLPEVGPMDNPYEW